MKEGIPPEIFATFFPYQQHWLEDESIFKIGLWARQTGKDYTCAAEAVADCLARPKTHWLIVACGERQAVESLEKAKEWTLAFASSEDITCKAREIRFKNGSRITALPAKPETIRGYSANLILTEFAFHDDPDKVWRAVFPSLTNPLRGGKKKLRIITTPNGQGNFFHNLWLTGTGFSRQQVTIHDAINAGLQVDLDQLRHGITDPEAWAQEYECGFVDRTSVLLPYELIESCESREATESSTPADLSRHSGELFMGIDFARRHDLTVAWTLERFRTAKDFLCVTREVLVLERMPTPDQFEMLRPRVALARRVSVDCTGAGVGLGDMLERQFGPKIEQCQFTPALKEELFPKLRAGFERRLLKIPSSLAIRDDLHSIHRVTTSAGRLLYRASRTADGHSDRATALALALRAAETTLPGAAPKSIPPPPRGFRRGA